MDTLSSSGTLNYMVAQFMPGAIMVIVSVALVAWMVRLGLFFYHRWKERAKRNELETKETMGLPKGAVRTFLALTFTAVAVIAVLGGDSVVGIGTDDKKWILGEFGLIIAFYFGSKTLESYVDSRAKLKAMEHATSVEEAMKIYRDEQ